MKMMGVGSLILIALVSLGCPANWNSIHRDFDLRKGESQMIDVRQRAVLVGPSEVRTDLFDNSGKITGSKVETFVTKVCAEPSPDAMAASAYELVAKGGVPAKVQVELAAAMQDSAAFVGLRTQSIQLLRDFGYRLCEGYLSGALDNENYDLLMRRFQKNVVALLGIEQLTGALRSAPIVLTSSGIVQTSKSLAELQDLKSKKTDEIAKLEKEKADLEKQKSDLIAKSPNADTSTVDSSIQDKEKNITQAKENIESVDQGIKASREMLARGKTEMTIGVDGAATQRSDTHIQEVASIVGEIVKDVVLSDDTRQICMGILRKDTLTDKQKLFADWCLSEMKNMTEANRIYLQGLAQPASTGEVPADSKSTQSSTKATPAPQPSQHKNPKGPMSDKEKKLRDIGRGGTQYIN